MTREAGDEVAAAAGTGAEGATAGGKLAAVDGFSAVCAETDADGVVGGSCFSSAVAGLTDGCGCGCGCEFETGSCTDEAGSADAVAWLAGSGCGGGGEVIAAWAGSEG